MSLLVPQVNQQSAKARLLSSAAFSSKTYTGHVPEVIHWSVFPKGTMEGLRYSHTTIDGVMQPAHTSHANSPPVITKS